MHRGRLETAHLSIIIICEVTCGWSHALAPLPPESSPQINDPHSHSQKTEVQFIDLVFIGRFYWPVL